jgi:hypothetical protein
MSLRISGPATQTQINVPFTHRVSADPHRMRKMKEKNELFRLLSSSEALEQTHKRFGGAGRDRTDDLKLAKLPLSQLSYSP